MKKGEYFEKNKPVDLYIDKASSPQKEILEELRNLIFRTVPNSVEQFKWNQPVYLNEKDFCYLKFTKNHVNLGFTDRTKIDDPNSMLEGSGKKMCPVKLFSITQIDQNILQIMIKQASLP